MPGIAEEVLHIGEFQLHSERKSQEFGTGGVVLPSGEDLVGIAAIQMGGMNNLRFFQVLFL